LTTGLASARRWTCALSGLLFSLVVLLVTAERASGQTESTDGKSLLEEAASALDREEGLSPDTRKALTSLLRSLSTDVEAAAEPSPWERALDRLTFYGDFRYRHESSFKLDGQKDRHRERLRVRLGVNYLPADELLLGFRMVTGDRKDPASPHVTLGDGFDDLEVSLDRAFVRYEPGWAEGVSATAGKFDHPFFRNPVYGELVWDADIQPEGVALRWEDGVGPLERTSLTLGVYTVLEEASTDDVFILTGEWAGRAKLGEKEELSFGIGYASYTDPTPDGSRTLLAENAGNRLADRDGDGTADDFFSDFGILNPVVAVRSNRLAKPVLVSGELIRNARGRGGEDTGWALGASVGGTQRKGDWRTYYQFQVVEQDAVFSPFAQDDFVLRTNHRSHVFGAGYQITDRVGLHLWGLVSERLERNPGQSDQHQWRGRLDLNIKF